MKLDSDMLIYPGWLVFEGVVWVLKGCESLSQEIGKFDRMLGLRSGFSEGEII